MGTRSVVAVPTGPTSFHGRYIHWDGYPTGVGVDLVEIVARDGYNTAVATLTEQHYGWSSLSAEQGIIGSTSLGDRSTRVSGYGEAYSHDEQPDEWVDSEGDDWGTEWAYVLGESGVTVFERVWSDTGTHATGLFGVGASGTVVGGKWRNRGTVRYGDAEGMRALG